LLTDKRLAAEAEAMDVFAENLRHLLLSAPAGGRTTLGVDPGIRTGVKLAVLVKLVMFLHIARFIHLHRKKIKKVQLLSLRVYAESSTWNLLRLVMEQQAVKQKQLLLK
jgi:transcriptional accessory protein Tex/SPT6